MVWIPLFLDPSDGVFGRFDLAALCGCRTLHFCLFCLSWNPHCRYLSADTCLQLPVCKRDCLQISECKCLSANTCLACIQVHGGQAMAGKSTKTRLTTLTCHSKHVTAKGMNCRLTSIPISRATEAGPGPKVEVSRGQPIRPVLLLVSSREVRPRSLRLRSLRKKFQTRQPSWRMAPHMM